MAGAPNWLQRALIPRMLRKIRIDHAETIAPRLRRLELSGEALAAARFESGLRVGLVFDDSLMGRVYTPLAWAQTAGSLSLLVHLNGQGPGSHWAQTARPGQGCGFLGPEASVALPPPGVGGWLLGDETSLATAASMAAHGGLGDRQVALVLDDGYEAVLAGLGLASARVVRRASGQAHFAQIVETMGDARSAGTMTLTGEASMIAAVGRNLRARGVPSKRIRSRAYWAPGKVALS